MTFDKWKRSLPLGVVHGKAESNKEEPQTRKGKIISDVERERGLWTLGRH